MTHPNASREELQEFRELSHAIRRKVRITNYHARCLRILAAELRAPFPDEVPIAVQAHVEGLLHAAIGVTEQLAELLIPCRGRPPTVEEKRLPALERMLRIARPGPLIDELVVWYHDDCLQYARHVRNKATHYYYHKAPGFAFDDTEIATGDPEIDRKYSGSRCLGEFTSTLRDRVYGLVPLLPLLEAPCQPNR